MAVAPSFSDLLDQFEQEALEQTPTLTFNDGDMSVALQHGVGAMADANVRFSAQAFKETFIDGAKGDALKALVNDHLNIQAKVATPAQSTVTFTRNAGGIAGTLAAGFTVGTQFDASGNSITYTLDSALTWAAGEVGPKLANVTAELTGASTNAAVGTIVRVVDTPFDPSIAVTNAVVAGGGNDAETDDDLRVRARQFWTSLRRGTLAALEQGALNVASGTVRVARATEDPVTGIVTLVVSDADGNSTSQMISDTIAELENWRAAGSVVTVLGGTSLIVNVIGTLVVEDGVDASVLGEVAQDAVNGRMGKQRQGETLFIDSIKAAAIGVDPDAINALILITPTADVVPTANQIIRAGTVTIT